MTRYHEFMMTSALVMSAALFHGAAKLLSYATLHQQKIRAAEISKRFGYHKGNVIDIPLTRVDPSDVVGIAQPMPGYEHLGLLTPDEQEAVRQHENMHAVVGHLWAQNKWTEAEPCSDFHETFDPIHPDYRP